MLTETPSVLELLGKGVSLEELARLAAQQLIALAMEAEITASMEPYQQIKTPDGKAAVVRNGYLPERTIISTAGPLTVKVPRNRSFVPSIKPFASALIPKYMRKTLNIEEALSLFYLNGLTNKDFIPAFEQLCGELSASRDRK
jgi:transposase-like protein